MCEWCDTKYSWDTWIEIPVSEVINSVRRYGTKRVVITGGEPTIQMDEVEELSTRLRKEGYHVSLETNGIIDDYDTSIFDLVVVSPKFTTDWDKWIRRNVVFKFVINSNNVDMIMQWILMHDIKNVYLMPFGTTPQEILLNSDIIITNMEEYEVDVFLTPRLHILLGVK
jgi:organic radical activating enzyme